MTRIHNDPGPRLALAKPSFGNNEAELELIRRVSLRDRAALRDLYLLYHRRLSRFLMRVTLGYPDAAHERELLRNGARRDLLQAIPSALSPEGVIELQSAVRNVHVSDPLLDYAQTLIARTRERADLKLGLSPRAGQGLMRAAQAWAFVAGRDAVLPDDIQAVFPAVVSHRLERRDAALGTGGSGIATELIRAVPVPP